MKKLFLATLTVLFSPLVQAETSIQPGDLSIIFPAADNAARVERYISLRDLDLSEKDLQAILAQSMRTIVPKSEKNRFRGSGPDDLHKNPCFLDIANWKVTAIRFSPYEFSLPGSRSRLADYAKQNGISGLDRVFQFRLSINPICPAARTELDKDGNVIVITDPVAKEALDVGLHLIYEEWPSDPTLRGDLLQSRSDYLNGEAQGDRQMRASQAALGQHIALLNSKPYVDHHRAVIARLEALAVTRTEGASNFLSVLYEKAFKEPIFGLSSLDRETGEEVQVVEEAARVTPALQWSGDSSAFQNEKYYEVLKKLVIGFSKRDNLERVALNTVTFGDSWKLSGLLPTSRAPFQKDIFARRDQAKAKELFSTLFPQELKTQQVIIDQDGRLRVKDVSTSGYFAEVGIPEKAGAKIPSGIKILDQKLFGEVDFFQVPSNGEFPELRPKPKAGELLPLNKLLNDVERVNASVTTCATCHAFTVTLMGKNEQNQLQEDISSSFSTEPQADVRMMGIDRFNRVTLRSLTINEVAYDYKKLRAYLDAE